MAAHGVRFHAEDIWDAPEDDKIYEVIDGELYVSPSPSWWHQLAVGNLYAILWHFIRTHDLGKIVTAPLGVVLGPEDGVEPDLVYVSRERMGIITDRGVEGAPDLVVEVLSPSTRSRDLGIKLRRYAAAGVPHYWVLDTDAHELMPFRLGAQGYEPIGTFGPGTLFRPDLFPGLEIPIDDLWG
jgi:Uma2 family endonuclease